MRGTPNSNPYGSPRNGIIPAYAGNTRLRSRATFQSRDHPRVCGEHLSARRFPARFPGSSPRMRGTPLRSFEIYPLDWIIPAYAGNTNASRFCATASRDHPRVCGEHRVSRELRRGRQDHPRVCGEHCFAVSASMLVSGSSPRMRGTLVKRHINIDRLRIIPAYAGNTKFYHMQITNEWDHPRVCGEHTKKSQFRIP